MQIMVDIINTSYYKTPEYEYQSLIYHSEMDISFPDWLNEKCAHWKIIHIETIKGITLYRIVTMSRIKLIARNQN